MHSVTSTNEFTYIVDEDDRIVSISDNWDSFALENKAPDLTAQVVVGQSLFTFVADEATQHIYRIILEQVRRTGRTIVFSYRCDSPSVRRFMELRISRSDEGNVQFDSRIMREEPRDPVLLLDEALERSDDFLSICGWCKKVHVSGEWMEVELALERLDLFGQSPLPRLTHGICPACTERMMQEIAS
ncbi:MAG: hypothetical protein COV99_07455 [Bacteroidetes bacterium CG12_big_fil_rev_8_21_14_0_65_60_17]|nr:MAG: hypothetical protein COV99_07455 [Bacteroidetes bacterium CG12_big_fil_rev_8_21_14_0_65_60_17]